MRLKICLKLILTIGLFYSCNEKLSAQELQKFKESAERGAIIYKDFCMVCHLPDGNGVSGVYPPLANSDYLKTKRAKSIKSIKYGLSGEIKVNGETYNSIMAPLGLTDKEIADVMNYITTSWGNKNTQMITEAEVSKIQPKD
ncbi:cytochrome c [Flavobacteriaceae bacterium MAR_2010_72]|nr:cytochrome c [Flavobacteriaceae bacterium MAR_2010_72]TVZ60243.1 cytochrome c [Flavobacteriaceae bacterium MAR_2010_105]